MKAKGDTGESGVGGERETKYPGERREKSERRCKKRDKVVK